MSGKSIEVIVENNTHRDFYLKHIHLDDGLWVILPEDIPNNESGAFKAKSRDGITDITGYVTWARHGNHVEFEIAFDKPVNDCPTDFTVLCPDEYRYTISGDPLLPNAVVTVSFYRQDPA